MSYCLSPEYHIEVVPYIGNKDEILRVRNRNRENAVTKEYLDWRYQGKNTTKEAVIFLIKSEIQEVVGMASLIYRGYLIKGEKTDVPVLGDISINKDLRGKGIAKILFECINDYLDNENVPFAFVLPNIQARKSLTKASWHIQQKMERYVFFLNLKKESKHKKDKVMLNVLGDITTCFIKFLLFMKRPNDIEMRHAKRFCSIYNEFSIQTQNKTTIERDRTSEYLNWRYMEHPYDKFTLFEFYRRKEFIGYIVAKISEENNTLVIYEIFSKNHRNLASIIVKFLYSCTCKRNIFTIRITLNQENSYKGVLRKICFIKRPTENVFQTYALKPEFSGLNWLVTSGDKDV